MTIVFCEKSKILIAEHFFELKQLNFVFVCDTIIKVGFLYFEPYFRL